MNLKKLPIEEFVTEIKVGGSYPDHRYTLFLGAGCSKSSGIPTAGELVLKRWIPQMAPSGEDPIKWAENHIDGFDRNDPAASYGAVIEQCFRIPRVRQAEIERICKGVSPDVGYSVVAQLCTQNNTPFSAVLTTNFDDLVASAMIIYTSVHPLVINDESLANQIHSTRSGPMVVKLHGDARLSPKNTTQETKEIDKALREQAKKLLDGRGLLFFGYAGADNSVVKMLAELRPKALELGVYWVNEKLPAEPKFREWLEGRKAAWVRHTDFDEAMRHFRREYDLQPLRRDRIDKVFNENKLWSQQARTDRGRIAANFIHDEEKARFTAETKAARSSIDAWRSVNEILAMDKQDPDIVLSAYQAAVSEHPGFAPLLNNYAVFLTDVRGDYDAAENFFKRAVNADPKRANNLGNYANFLTNVRRDHDAAENFYKRAIDADPRHANNLGNYANFLTDIRGDHDAAENFYKHAIDADPKHANNLSNYASFLADVRGDHDDAETFYKRAIDADPKHANSLGNYAIFLKDVRGDHDAAETLYKRAIDADPKHTNSLNNYANFLKSVRCDHDAAETFYKRAIEADPKHANILGNYANFLKDVRDDHDTAETFYKRAIEADPRHANILNSYAVFLTDVRGDHDDAETFFKRAIEADPRRARNLSNYAIFLNNVRGDHDDAETFFKRAIEADPKDAHILHNYAIFLKNVRGDHDAAETFYKRAIDANPKHANILGNYGEFLLYRSERERGFDFLDRSDKVAKDTGDFNRMTVNDICRAIYSAGADRRAALSRLHQSLRAIKAPCPSWSQAERKRRLSISAIEDRKWLAKLIDVSEGKAKIDELDDWQEWQEASDMRLQ